MKRWLLLCLLMICIGSYAHATTYFVKNGGSDAAAGTSDATAWANISKVNSTAFSAGDIIQFKRGSTFTGALVVDSNGTSGNPVTYQAYDVGAAPILQTAASHQTSGNTLGIQITGDWNVVKDLLVRNAHYGCIDIDTGADNNVVQGNETTACGNGVIVEGNNGLVTQNYVHDLEMVTNTSSPTNDDFGATCFWLVGNSLNNNEISYNTGIGCRAPSFDYGFDGGFVELFTGGTISNTKVHHNYAENTIGFIEAGSTTAGSTVSGLDIYYNVIKNVHEDLSCFHDSGTFGIGFSNITISNNTWFHNLGTGTRVFACTGSTPSWMTVRNNIFYSDLSMTQTTGYNHSYNRYFMTGGASVGYALGTGETSGDPLFVTAGTDFHLQSGSACRDAGTNLGYTLDFEGNPVPDGAAPDMGAYEFVSADTTAPAPPTNLRVLP